MHHRPHRTASVVVLVVLAALLSAASAVADQYVALGDSYSSGVGTRTYFEPSCKRSLSAYPELIARERPSTSLVFAACSGAKTGDVLSRQVSSLATSTAIATITIGGNDAGFSEVITQCALPWPFSCNSNISNAQSYIRNTLPGQLNNVYASIRSHAPSARVIVLGYPRLFMGVDCNAGTFFSEDEMRRLNETADLMRNVERERAVAAGDTFVDAIPAFTGHAVCSSSEWLNGLSNPVEESYHPNTNGHRLGYEPLVRAIIG
ncbi:MAG TPA: SGNH/GDSL hydrolase family protein [Conexibacter sp.]|nr:SGNH/GDSL hydrolase family protein [Conexibacter sp.]